MENISPFALQQRLAVQPAAAIIDVRTPVEFDEVHAPLAQNVPLDALKPESLALPKDAPVYLLCRSGQRATKAAEKLSQAGFLHPVVVTGGTLAWVAAGLPVNRSATPVMSLERQVRIAAGALGLTGVLLAWWVDSRFIWLSGFVGAGLIFAGITDFCGMGLLLAKMPWNQRKL